MAQGRKDQTRTPPCSSALPSRWWPTLWPCLRPHVSVNFEGPDPARRDLRARPVPKVHRTRVDCQERLRHCLGMEEVRWNTAHGLVWVGLCDVQGGWLEGQSGEVVSVEEEDTILRRQNTADKGYLHHCRRRPPDQHTLQALQRHSPSVSTQKCDLPCTLRVPRVPAW